MGVYYESGKEGNREECEKCGILREVGSDYIAIHEPRNGRLIITNMEKIKYISVFCV